MAAHPKVIETLLLNKSSAVAEMGDRLATIGMGRKWGGAAVGAESPLGPHLTQCGLGRGQATFLPSGILIHLTVWSHYRHNCRNATLLRVGIRLRTFYP